MRQFTIVGRKQPSEKEPSPTLYRMSIFAPNKVVAKSRFWYFLSKLRKMKKTTGEIVGLKEVFERNKLLVKNYGIWIRYNSRTGTHNMYKEFRDVSINAAVHQLYQDMAARHRARFETIHIIRVAEIPAKETRRKYIKMFHDNNIRFPLPNHRPLKERKFRALFLAKRPTAAN